MNKLDVLKDLMILLRDSWRKKSFSEDGLLIVGTICASAEMHANYGDTEQAIKKAIEIIKTDISEEQIIEQLSTISKII